MSQETSDALVIRMEAALTKFENQMKRAAAVARKSTTEIQTNVDRMNKRMAVQSAAAAGGLTRVLSISGRGRFVLQNTAAQLGDIAVQLEGGAGAARVMGQQLPQLLGGFAALRGAMGIVAPAIGTVLAVGIPLAAMFMRSGDSAEVAAEKVRTFAEKVRDAQAAVQAAQSSMVDLADGGLDDLEEKYGAVTRQVLELSAALTEIELNHAKISTGDVISEAFGADFTKQIEGIFGQLGADIADPLGEALALAQQEYDQFRANIEQRQAAGMFVEHYELEQMKQMREEIALLSGDLENAGDLAGLIKFDPDLLVQITKLQTGIQDAVAAGDFSAVAQSIAQIVGILNTTGAEIDQSLVEKLRRAEDAALQMAKTLEDGRAAAEGLAGVDVATGLSAAADQAARLIENLRNYDGLQKQFDIQSYGAAQAEMRQKILAGEINPIKPETGAGGGVERGGGGVDPAKQFNAKLQTIRSRLDPVFSAMTRFQETVGLLDAALAGENITLEQYNDLLSAAGSELGAVAADATKYAQIVSRLNALLAAGKISQGEFNSAMEAADAAFRAAQLGAIGFSGHLDSIADALAGAILGAENFGEAMSRVLAQIASDILSSGIRNLLGGIFSGGIGGGGGGFLAPRFGGFRAGGGPVQAGRAYVVGENRPELFVPNASGTILPYVPGAAGHMQVVIRLDDRLIGEIVDTSVAKSAQVSVQLVQAGAEDMRAGFGAMAADSGRRGV